MNNTPMGWTDKDAIEMAQTPGRFGGPGFERYLLIDVCRSWKIKDTLHLTRETVNGISSDGKPSYEWRLWDKVGNCVGLRYTST